MTRPLALALSFILLLVACDGPPPEPASGPGPDPAPEPYRPAVPETFGLAVMVVLDTSGSMRNAAPGDRVTKSAVARDAIRTVLKVTDDYVAKNPDRTVKVGLVHFSDRAHKCLTIGPYSADALATALKAVPEPGGETAIGDAMKLATAELYRSGCLSKYILVVTDGKNTRGVPPKEMAEEIHARSGGSVKMYFVAFDTDARKFAFLSDVGGDVLSARNADGLSTALKELYEGRILAEAPLEDTNSPR
jgi:Mg-chelatase subunit ChlD